MINFNDVKALLKSIRISLLNRANVVATGIGYKETASQTTSDLCIICSVAEKFTAFEVGNKDLIPEQVNGVPIDVKRSGIIKALKGHQSRMRPASGGVSIGHYAITAGTLGCLVKRDGKTLILSNNHVLANSNHAIIGDEILQPGPADGGVRGRDKLAVLYDFIPVHYLHEEDIHNQTTQYSPTPVHALSNTSRSTSLSSEQAPEVPENRVDAAIASPENQQEVSANIIDLGRIKGMVSATLGVPVVKSGRTTGLTEGIVEQVDVTADVDYGGGHIARFNDQLMAGSMSQGGDSGSAVLDDKGNIIGLLFAGSGTTTLINRIQNVFLELNITL